MQRAVRIAFNLVITKDKIAQGDGGVDRGLGIRHVLSTKTLYNMDNTINITGLILQRGTGGGQTGTGSRAPYFNQLLS